MYQQQRYLLVNIIHVYTYRVNLFCQVIKYIKLLERNIGLGGDTFFLGWLAGKNNLNNLKVICSCSIEFKLHPGGQAESFQRKKIQKMMNVEESIFCWSFPTNLVNRVNDIYKFREEYRKLS